MLQFWQRLWAWAQPVTPNIAPLQARQKCRQGSLQVQAMPLLIVCLACATAQGILCPVLQCMLCLSLHSQQVIHASNFLAVVLPKP